MKDYVLKVGDEDGYYIYMVAAQDLTGAKVAVAGKLRVPLYAVENVPVLGAVMDTLKKRYRISSTPIGVVRVNYGEKPFIIGKTDLSDFLNK